MMTDTASPGRPWPRFAILIAAALLGSLMLACVMPFVALAVLAALVAGRREALALAAAAWLANQLTGYLVLDYPLAFDSFAWGGALGIATLAAALLASAIDRGLDRLARPARIALAFAAGWLLFEAVLMAAGRILPGGDDAFALPVLAEVLAINALAFLLLGGGWLAAGRLAPVPVRRPALEG